MLPVALALSSLLGLAPAPATADPQIAALEEAWPRRDQPQEAAVLQTLVDGFAATQDYEKLWRASRWYAWLAGAEISNEEKQKLSKTGSDLGERAEKINPKGIEAKYWTSVNIGFYASAIPVFQALTLGIEHRFRDPLIAVAKANADQRSASVEYVGPEMVLGAYYFKMPWPKQDKGKSREWFARALAAKPENLRVHYLHGETLALDGDKAGALKELAVVMEGSEAYDPPDGRRFKRYAQKLASTLK
jgi:hypothetical protein